MAALLVAMSIMAIMMTVVMPVWKQAAQREKEEELDLPRPAVRPRDRPVPAQVRQRLPAEHRRAGRAAIPAGRSSRIRSRTTTSSRSRSGRRAGAPGQAPRHRAAGAARRPARRRRQPAGRGTTPATVASTDRPTQPGGALRGVVADIGTPGAGGGTTAGIGGVTQQEQGAIDSPLQRPQPLQRVGVRLRAAGQAPGAGARHDRTRPGTRPAPVAGRPGQRGGPRARASADRRPTRPGGGFGSQPSAAGQRGGRSLPPRPGHATRRATARSGLPRSARS